MKIHIKISINYFFAIFTKSLNAFENKNLLILMRYSAWNLITPEKFKNVVNILALMVYLDALYII